MRGRSVDHRRATVLFAVLFLVVVGALSATTMLSAVSAERAAVARELDELELRAAMRSALEVMLHEGSASREAVLRGGAPSLPEEIEIARGEGRGRIVVRLMPGGGGVLVEPETARLDLNRAPEEALARLPGLSGPLAGAIVASREQAWFQSPEEVRSLPEAGGAFLADSIGSDPGEDFGANDGIDPLRLLTVFSFEPESRAGIGDEEDLGRPRVNINAPWSDALEKAVASELDEATAEVVRGLFVDAPRIEKRSDLVDLLIRKAVPRESWARLLDALTVSAEPYRLGAVDVNRASREVLEVLPGLDAETAQELVSTRERLDESSRRSVTWPLDEGVVDEESFRLLVDHAVTRSLQWRFVLRASFEPGDEAFGDNGGEGSASLLPEPDEFGVEIEEEDKPEASAAIEYEVVLDLAGPRPRLAYLRDRTGLAEAVRLASLPEFGVEEPAPGAIEAVPGGERAGSLDDPASRADEGEPGVAGTAQDPGPEPASFPASFFDGPVDEAGDASDGAGSGGPAAGPGGAGGDNRLGRWAPARGGGSR
jgi:DNA uptake protein ComE-like DNA-binding protein